ncbi:major vault protein-like [Aplysia californica]|uniref:Major vault protein n=1 Tax=Aplysia californica TaxID=6500 RepID=A0ABM1VVR2_APLCA|nr:major vault protein-like [Aplysia californica]
MSCRNKTSGKQTRRQSRSRSRSRSRSPDRSRGWRSFTRDLEEVPQETTYRIPPYYYIHVLDSNTNVTSTQIGPQTFVRQDHKRVNTGPQKMIVVPPRHYCTIKNPVQMGVDGSPQMDDQGQVIVSFGELEIRLHQPPFPLYPGEVLCERVSPLKIVAANTALRIRAVLDYTEDDGTVRTAGDEWLFEGPGTFIPRKETVVDETVRASIIMPGHGLVLRARKECVDRNGQHRVTGEKWLVKTNGAYLPGAYEEVVDTVKAFVLTEKKALHMRCLQSFKDDFGVNRKNGEEWLITMQDTEAHIPNVYEEAVGVVKITSLTNRQYCVILDPIGPNGKPQLGRKKLVKGEANFFLMPGEKLEKGIQNVYILGEDEGLVLRANDEFKDGEEVRAPGDQWMIRGPVEYIPSIEVEVVLKRRAIPLDENEGIYVRNMKTGKVRAITGETYMLKATEELWEKELPDTVEMLILSGKDPLADRNLRGKTGDETVRTRDKTRIVKYCVPHNAAVQIYDYKDKTSRVIFGPELVKLGPDEQFTQLSLSGGKPKQNSMIKAICLLLGPDFSKDVVTVETSDHARLSIQLAYNWHFDVSKKSPEENAKLFSVPDFVGDSCKAIASRVRGAVAQVPFDEFHKNSATLIRSAVFGYENDRIGTSLRFSQNNLVITSVDIQSVEPVDQRTREALQKSVQLAIEITTKSQEAAAKHEAERLEQQAKGRLERQKLQDEAEAEKARKNLLELQANSAAVESTGQAKAEAQSRAEALKIEGEASVAQARLKAEALAIETDAELERLGKARDAELTFLGKRNRMDVEKMAEVSSIEMNKFKDMVSSIGSDTLRAMATAGPDQQVRMLQSLGLKSTLITDGSTPINLFNTAAGLIGELSAQPHAKKRRVESDGEGTSEAAD